METAHFANVVCRHRIAQCKFSIRRCGKKLTSAHDSLEHAVQLPKSGPNFEAYSALGVMAGRTYVHSVVGEVVLEAYQRLARTAPSIVFVYGETGRAEGGTMAPHKTYQAGLSVDFMVPVLDQAGSPANKFGYGIEFDNTGQAGKLRIDYEAMAEHLYQLTLAAGITGAVSHA